MSLTIMALITSVAAVGLGVAIDSWERGSEKIEELERQFALERLVQRQVSLAFGTSFEGTDRQLEFVSSYSLLKGAGDSVLVRYVSDGGNFVYSEAPFLPYSSLTTAPAVTETLGTFTQLDFSYFLRDADGRPSWVQSWTEDKGLPLAVRVRLGGNALTIALVNHR